MLVQAPDAPQAAFTARRRLVEIHRFNDGNGRTARLLMNLILLCAGYPSIAVRPEDRPLQAARAGDGAADFDRPLYERLDATLDEYLAAARQGSPAPSATGKSP